MSCCSTNFIERKEFKATYPEVRESDHTDVLHGIEVADPYRYLEDPEAEETKEFVEKQNLCTSQVFKNIPFVKNIKDRMTELENYEKYSSPMKYGGQYFFFKNDGLQNQSVLYRQETLESAPSVLLNPNTLSDDGTAALSSIAFSKGKLSNHLYMSYGISRGGSDWQTLKVLSVNENGKQFDDVIQWAKFTEMQWTHDDEGFFYTRFPAPPGLEDSDPDDQNSKRGTETSINTDQQIWYHRLGTKQCEDRLVFKYPQEPTYYIGAEISEDGNYLLIYLREGCKNATMVKIAHLGENFESFLNNKDMEIISTWDVVDNMEASYHYLLNNGTEFYFKTNLNAPRERIVKLDVGNPSVVVEIVPQHKDGAVLSDVVVANQDNLVVVYMKDVKDVVSVLDLEGNWKYDLELPSIGSVYIWGKRSEKEIFFKFVSFLYPGSIYHYDFESQQQRLYKQTVVQGLNPEDFEAKQVFYTSKDKTSIPMFIIAKKGLEYNGNNPAYLYGYGGFYVSITPSFSIYRLIFLQNFGGVLAIANIRGGGEYGEEWHQAGTFEKKQNVFDDFHGAAEYLIAQKYTKSSKLAIHGGSNGGLLVAACCNQRPELYGCGVAAVGVMDMLRFHKFTVGKGWRSDFGDPDLPGDFKYIYAYSPLHNVPTQGPYPAILLTTGDHDDRVVPLHSLKLIAQLQKNLGNCQNSGPLLIRIETKAGHGAQKPTSKVIEEYADVYAFIAWSLDVTPKF